MSGPWFKFYPASWASGVRGLTLTQKGLFIELISLMYDKDGPLTESDEELALQIGARLPTFQAALGRLIDRGLITRDERGLMSRRAAKEINLRAQKCTKAANSAAKRWGKCEQKQKASNADALRTQCEGNAKAMLLDDRSKKLEKVPASPDEASPVPEDDRTILFREGLGFVMSRGIPERQARSLLGKCLQLCGDDATAVLEAVREAYRTRPAELQPWLLGRFKAKPKAQRFDRWAGVGDPNRDPFADEVPPSSDPFEGLDLGNVVAFGGRS